MTRLTHITFSKAIVAGAIIARAIIAVAIIAVVYCLLFTVSAFGVSRDTLKAEIEAARENLRISMATEDRITSELEKLKQSGNPSPDIIADYEVYLSRVQAMVAENRKILKKMEDAYARYYPSKSSPDAANADKAKAQASTSMVDPEIPEEQVVDEVAALDRELDSSLSEFDEQLRKELDLIKAKSEHKMRDLAQEAAEAAKRLRQKGVDLDSSSTETSAESEEKKAGEENDAEAEKTEAEKDESGSEKTKDTEKGEAGEEMASRDTSRGDGEGPTRDEKRYGTGEDDDIVARQLREAAENETDPELKEKLWKEYEEYKKNTAK
jgi:hypothetical protein